MRLKHHIVVLGLFCLSLAQSVRADVFSVSMHGMQIGTLDFTHNSSEGRYDAQASFRAVGLVGAVFPAAFEAKTVGAAQQYRVYHPEIAQIAARVDDKDQNVALFYRDDVLTMRKSVPERSIEFDPATQKGGVDPLTAFVYVSRTMPHDQLCEMKTLIFDGVHIQRVRLLEPKLRQDGRFSCEGVYERVNGYSNGAESFYFTALYAFESEGLYGLDRIVAESPYGKLTLVRQRL